MRYIVTKQRVQVIGKIWQPGVGICAEVKDLTDYDMSNIEDPGNLADVEHWISLHFGDFREILDFRADFHWNDIQIVYEWKNGEESELAFADAMFPSEDDF